MPYNFVSEDNDKFTLSNGDNEFSIAKYDLDDGFMERLRSLPRVEYGTGGRVGFAEGGMVEEPAPSGLEAGLKAQSGISDIFSAVANPLIDVAQTGLQAPTSRGLQFAPYGQFAPQKSTGATGTWEPSAQAGINPEATATPEAAASAGQEQPAYLKMMQDLAASGQPAPFMMPEDIRAGFDKMQKGAAAQAEAHAQAAMEQSRLYEEQAKDLALMEIARKKNFEALDNETKTLQADVSNNKVDPTRIYNNMSTGNRVMAGISLLLGGLSQGLTGGKTNPAMDVINNAIDRDIDAQKAELGKKQNLLAINLQKYGRLDAAFQATKMQMMAVTQAQINQQAAKMGSKQALANAQIASGQMDVQLAMYKQQLASAAAKDQLMNKPEGLTAKDLMKLDQETRSRMVQMPNGNFMEALNEKSAEEVKKAQAKYVPIKDLANQFYVEMERGAVIPQGITPSAFQSIRQQRAAALEQSMTVELKNLFELGALTKDDMRLIQPLVPEIGKIVNPEAQKAAVDFILQRVNSRLNAVYSANVPGLNPSGRKSREISPFVRP